MSLYSSLELDTILEQIQHLCQTDLGRRRIQALQPSFEPLRIRLENGRIKETMQACLEKGVLSLAGVHDCTAVFENARRGRILTIVELGQVLRFLRAVRAIKAYDRTLLFPHPLLHDLFDSLIVKTKEEMKLDACIDVEEGMKDDASEALKEIRRSLREAQAAVNEAANAFLQTHKDSVVDSIVTYRNERALVLVRASDKNMFKGLVYGDSASGQASYIEPAALMAANNRVQSVRAKEAQEVNRILTICSHVVQEISEEELGNLETCGILDALFAKADWGMRREACVASLVNGFRIDLEKARHPLIDPKKVVSNTYRLTDPQRILLITGPNTGGKTVSLKIIGLFTLLSYCGIPVPCASAVLPFFDAVYADIGDDQSVASSLSSFSAHVEKQADALAHATEKSLVLLDEIGSGTDPREGEALAIAILNALRQRGTTAVVTTHYSRLKAYGKRHDDILLASVQFDMEKLAPTYVFQQGVSGSSNALEVAERYGLPNEVIKEARFLKVQARSQEDQLIERLDRQLAQAKEKNEQLNAKLQEITQFQKKLKQEQAQFEAMKDAWKIGAQEQAAAYVEGARKKADAILKKIRQRQTTAKYHEILAERAKLETPEPVEKESTKTPHAFAVGDIVELRTNGQVARIIRVNRKDITIDLNGREVHVRAPQIRPSLRVLAAVKPKPEVNIAHASVFASFTNECNLIGMHTDEAVEELYRYMSDAAVRGVRQVRIIHGDGSGALRSAVWHALRQMPNVASFEMAPLSQGGSGATIVKMQ